MIKTILKFFFPYFYLVHFSDITVLLSLTVFHNIVNDTLPQVSDSVPVIGTRVGVYNSYSNGDTA